MMDEFQRDGRLLIYIPLFSILTKPSIQLLIVSYNIYDVTFPQWEREISKWCMQCKQLAYGFMFHMKKEDIINYLFCSNLLTYLSIPYCSVVIIMWLRAKLLCLLRAFPFCRNQKRQRLRVPYFSFIMVGYKVALPRHTQSQDRCLYKLISEFVGFRETSARRSSETARGNPGLMGLILSQG